MLQKYDGPTSLQEAHLDWQKLSLQEYHYTLGMICLISKDSLDIAMDEEALEHFQIAADDGNKISQVIVAVGLQSIATLFLLAVN